MDRTNREVDSRHPAHMRGTLEFANGAFDANQESNNSRNEVLNDLLWTLYSKFEAIAEGHRVVHDVVAGIVQRGRLRHSQTLTRGFKEMWKLYQSEVSSFLHTSETRAYDNDRCDHCYMTI